MTNIRSEQSYLNSIWDWTPYNACFPGTKIRVTDIDGLIEHRGYFLVLETKQPGVPVPKGQEILFNALTTNDHWHVMIIWGQTNTPEYWQIWRYSKVYRGGEAELKSHIQRWFNHVRKLAGVTP